jgi:hypothetical protein
MTNWIYDRIASCTTNAVSMPHSQRMSEVSVQPNHTGMSNAIVA